MKLLYWLTILFLITVVIYFFNTYHELFLANVGMVRVTAYVPLKEGSKLMMPSVGGFLTTSANNNDFTVTMPANFTTGSSQVNIKAKSLDSRIAFESTGAPPANFKSASSIVFDLGAHVGSNKITSFSKPVTISFQYTSADVSGLDESTLGIYHYREGSWEKLDDCFINTNTKIITCSTTSFSMFAIFAQSQTTSQSSGDSIGGGGNSIGGGSIATPQNQAVPNSSSVLPQNIDLKNNTVVFGNNLKFRDSYSDVKRLQQFLNDRGYVVSKTGPGSKGQETIFFGLKTKAALIKFQEDNITEILKPLGLTKGTGVFGAFTRKFINGILAKPSF